MSDKRIPKEATTYMKIVVAAKEARRMNQERIGRGLENDQRMVKNEAIRRAFAGEVKWEIEAEKGTEDPAEASSEEPEAEETPIDD